MGAAESIHQAHGLINDDVVNGDGENSSAYCVEPKSFRLPQNHIALSPCLRKCTHQPKAKGRPACTTSSTILTYESAPYSPYSPYSLESLDTPGDHPSGRDDDSTAYCWAGPMLKTIISLVSPQKPRCIIDSAHSKQEAADNAASNLSPERGMHSQECQLDFSVKSDQSCASPSGVQDFPTLPSSSSASDLPCKSLFHDLQPKIIEQEQYQESPPIQAQDTLISDRGTTPRRRIHLTVSEHLEYLLNAASKYEAESDLEAAMSSLETYLHKSQQSLASPTFASDHSKATTLHKLGILQWKCGRYFFSEHILTDCIHLYQCLLDGDNPALNDQEMLSQLLLEIAHVFVSTGRVYLSKGEGEAAMQCYNDCVRHLSSIPRCGSTSIDSARIFAQACVGAGRALACQGKLKASLKRYKRALKVQLGYQAPLSPIEEGDISSLSVDEVKVPLNDVAETLSHLGRLYEQWDQLTLAMECHAKALSFYQAVLDPYSVDIGYASNNVGQMYLRLGRIAEAEKALKLSHQVFSQSLGRNHRNTADALLSLGQLYASRGQQKKALTTYKKVLRAEPAVFGHLLAVTLHSIACCYEAMMRLDKALKYYQREVNIMAPCHLHRAQLLHHMATIAMKAVDSNGDYVLLDQAADWLEEAAAIYYNNESKSFDNDLLLHLEASIEETRRRMKRNCTL